MRLEYSATRSMSCSTRMIAFTPARFAASITFLMMPCLSPLETPLVGSSSRITSGDEGEGAGDVEQLLLALREQARLGVELAVEAEDRRDLAHARAQRRVAAHRGEEVEALAGLRDDGDGDRLGDRQRREDVHQLEGARHAALRQLHRADAGDVVALEAHHAARSA